MCFCFYDSLSHSIELLPVNICKTIWNHVDKLEMMEPISFDLGLLGLTGFQFPL